MSGPWDAKFTAEQKEAAALARVDGHRTARRVAEMAAAGELTHRGEPVGAFDISSNYVNQLGERLKRTRRGETVSKLAEMPHRDAIEVLRRRLVSVGDAVLTALEKQAEKEPAKLDLERLRQAGRVVVELGKIPAATEPQPTQARRAAAGQTHTPTRGGPAGALLREHRRQAETAQDGRQRSAEDGEQGAAHDSARLNGAQQDDGPGALPSEQRAAAAPLAVGG